MNKMFDIPTKTNIRQYIQNDTTKDLFLATKYLVEGEISQIPLKQESEKKIERL